MGCGRSVSASINFITCHDGFTLYDLVSYNEMHNEANGENNNDGSNDNNSWNCGTEGETDNKEIKSLRLRQMENMMTILLTSRGVPMIYSGDEIAYNKNIAFMEKDTIDWGRTGKDYRDLISNLSQIKSQHPALYSDNTGDGFEILNLENKNVFAFNFNAEKNATTASCLLS